jgi:xylose isomerase
MFLTHIGGIDTVARALIVAARLADEGVLSAMKAERYAGWDAAIGAEITAGSLRLADLAGRVESGELDPRPISGRQELYECVVGDAVWAAGDRP